MDIAINNILYLHIATGILALLSGAMAIFSKKGKTTHRKTGKLYVYAMTAVFITGLILAGYKFNRFLFLIAFLSYYSVFCGVRSLRLKQLHKSQRPKWYDWLAGALNTLANLIFLGLGIYYLISGVVHTGGIILTIGFGLGGLLLSYVNLKPFILKPKVPYHWYLSHIGNMMGGYIATFTAFLSTIVTHNNLMNPYIAFALPSLIGIPLLIYWQNRIEKTFKI